MEIPQIDIGATGSVEQLVGRGSLATTLGSGTTNVYGTPAMIALMEQAAVTALTDILPDNLTSVGIRLDVQHLAATPLGMDVSATAVVTAVDGRIVTFTVSASDDVEEIGRGTHQRAIVDAAKFQQRVNDKGTD